MTRAIVGALLLAGVLPLLGDCGVSQTASERTSRLGQGVGSKYNWLQFGGESSHSGDNTSETLLTSQNVGSLSQLFRITLPGNIEGAPVVLTNVSTPSGV